MKLIKLHNKNKEEYTIVDDEDYEIYKDKPLYMTHNGYVRTSNYFSESTFARILMHCPKGMTVDHINGNQLDNRKSNLRICEMGQNACNKKIYKCNKTGYKGVYVTKRGWKSIIVHNHEVKYIGSFETKEEAAIAYNEYAIKYFGEFARLNVIR
jgi:hypothetical protein